MRVLYAIQGTGNGHLSRANDIVPLLQERVQLDVLVSGIQADVQVPFSIDYRLKGLSFTFGKKGGVDLWDTYKKAKVKRLIAEIKALPIQKYDLVISDFELVSTWAAQLRKVPCIALSHQAAVLHPKAPQPEQQDWFGRHVLRHYAPAETQYGFHFEAYADSIFTPVIRQQIRQQTVTNQGHYTVYLPAYSEEKLVRKLQRFGKTKWHVFVKHIQSPREYGNVKVFPIQNEAFVKSMASSTGVLCGAGFETPAEALFLGKKLMVIPMKAQYEQQCNAAALAKMGVPVLKNLKEKRLEHIERWLQNEQKIEVYYPDQTAQLLDVLLERHLYNPSRMSVVPPESTDWSQQVLIPV
jgi:uncharacterized protein (TIGR00661 family)